MEKNKHSTPKQVNPMHNSLRINPTKNTARLWQVFVIVCLCLCGGCGLARPAEIDPAAREAGILFQDNFTGSEQRWGIWSGEGALVDYQQGALHFLINQPQYDFWSVAGQNFADVRIDVDAVKWAGPDDNDFGLICRYVDKNNFYMLVISSDGYYGIAKMVDGQYSMIGAELLQYSSAILQGQAVNHLRADCLGSTLRLYANDQLLMETSDATFSSGDVGVVVGSYQEGGVEVFFDNFLVQQVDD